MLLMICYQQWMMSPLLAALDLLERTEIFLFALAILYEGGGDLNRQFLKLFPRLY
jgi:hypothetical protein